MGRISTQFGCTVERRLCHDPECSAQVPGPLQRKPPQSVHERIELCSSFLAERGCLTPFRPDMTPEESAA